MITAMKTNIIKIYFGFAKTFIGNNGGRRCCCYEICARGN